MERLWTPWRMSYVTGAAEHARRAQREPDAPNTSATPGTSGAQRAGPGDGACFLCEKAAAPVVEDESNLVLYRGEHGLILLNLYPYNSGHLMAAPYTHLGDLTQLPAEVGHALFDLTQRAVAALQVEYRPDGLNVGLNLGRAAGAGLPDHVHVHIVPRWIGDTNFMTVVGQTKVMPEALDQTWTRLRRHFR